MLNVPCKQSLNRNHSDFCDPSEDTSDFVLTKELIKRCCALGVYISLSAYWGQFLIGVITLDNGLAGNR